MILDLGCVVLCLNGLAAADTFTRNSDADTNI